MRIKVAGTLALVVALAGLPLGRAPASGHPQAPVAAPPALQLVAPASHASDTGGGVIRKGPFITQLITPGLTVSVPGYADIFLAGRSFPLNVTGPFGTDIAQRNGPARVKIEVPGGHAITIATKFGTSHGFSILPAKDANGYVKQSILAGPSEPGATKVGISSVRAPIDSLVGVFTGKKPNKGKAPPMLDFSTAKARDQATVRPRLNQVFFIGTGVTSKGQSKHFIIPKGAAFLYLGSLDHVGSNHDDHGSILAFVSGQRVVVIKPIPNVQPTPTRKPTSTSTPTPRPGPKPTRKPTRTATPIGVLGMILPTDTNTRTPTVTRTPVLPSGGFGYNAQGQVVNAQGTPVALNAQGTPVNAQGTPVNAQGQTVNAQGTPQAGGGGTSGGSSGGGGTSGGGSSGGGTSGGGTSGGGTSGGGSSGGGTSGGGSSGGSGGSSGGGAAAATNTTVPTVTNVPTATATPTATTSGTPTITPTSTPGFQPITEAWEQFQFDQGHAGFQNQDVAANANATDPNADPNSPFYAGKMRRIWVSPAINGNVSVNGGPVLGQAGIYFTGGDGSLRCVNANALPTPNDPVQNAQTFTCPGGFGTISFGPNSEDNVPVINVSPNVTYYLSHNNPFNVLANQAGLTGSLTAYNATTGGTLNYQNKGPLVTAAGVALTEFNNTCYVATNDPERTGADVDNARKVLHFLNCGPNGDGADKLYIPAIGTSPTPTAPPTPLIGIPTPIAPPPLPPPPVTAPDASRLEGIPLSGAVVTGSPLNLVIVAERDPGGTTGTLEAFFDADSTGGNIPGQLAWAVPLPGSGASYTPYQPLLTASNSSVIVATNYGVAAYSTSTGGQIWSRTGTDSTNRVVFTATGTPAYNPITNMVYVGLPDSTNPGGLFHLVALNAATGATVKVGPADASPITGAPVTDHGVPTAGAATSGPNDVADVVFYADNAGAVFALNAVSMAQIASFPDLARRGIVGNGGSSIGATLVVANGHVYYGNSVGSIFNYGF